MKPGCTFLSTLLVPTGVSKLNKNFVIHSGLNFVEGEREKKKSSPSNLGTCDVHLKDIVLKKIPFFVVANPEAVFSIPDLECLYPEGLDRFESFRI